MCTGHSVLKSTIYLPVTCCDESCDIFDDDASVPYGIVDVHCCHAVLTEVAASKTVRIEKRFVEIEDHGIKLRLTIVDTPGFGDMVDASQWYVC